MKKNSLAVLLLSSFLVTQQLAAQNVGINTPTPAFPLDVKIDSTGTALRLRANKVAPGIATYLRFSNTTYTGNSNVYNSFIAGVRGTSDAEYLIFGTTDGSLSGLQPPTEKMRLDSAGNLGIGMIPGSYKLAVDGNIAVYNGNGLFRGTLSTTGYDLVLNAKKKGLFGTDTVGHLILQSNLGSGIQFASPGFVGIGTDTPTSKLHLYGDMKMDYTDPIFQLQNVHVDKGFIQLVGDDIRIGTNSSNNLGKFIIRTNGADRFYVDQSGNVSIGTSVPATGYKLSIDGKLMCEELKVQLSGSWPDYVFNDQYRLMPLSDLRSFIRQNNHLPNMPAAADVEKNGLTVGEMQKKMMEKIEELTLYILKIEEDKQQLQQRISVLEKKQ